MEEKSNVTLWEIVFVAILTVVFITLKVLGVIAWPWIWILAPVWVAGGLAFLKSMGIELPDPRDLIFRMKGK